MLQQNNSSGNKRIARNSVYMSIRMVIVLFLSFYTTRAVLEILGVEDYGVYNVVCGFVTMFCFLNTSMSNGIQRFFNYEYSKKGELGANKVYCTAVVIQVILAAILIIAIEVFGIWYLHNKMVIPPDRMVAAEWIFQFSVLSFVFVILQAPFGAAIMAHEKMDFYAFVNVLDAILKLGIVFAIPLFNADNLVIYGILLTLISILNFLLYYLYCKRKFHEISFHFIIDKNLFKSMLGFSGWNIFGSFSGVMKEQGINLVINLFFGPIVNAARGIAAQVNAGLQGFVANITIPVRPQVIQSYAQGNIDRMMNLTYCISKLSCGFLYLMALPVSWEINFLLHIWLGDNVPEHANTFVIIILLTSFLNNLNGAISGVVHATGKMRLYQLSTSVTALLAVPSAYFILKLGADAEWALMMVVVTMVIAQTMALFVLKHLINFSIIEYCRKVIVPLFVVVAITAWIPFLIKTFFETGWLRLILNTTLCVVSIPASFYCFGLQSNEKALVKEMIYKLKKKV